VNVVLISTYELGRQPFGLASPAAWLARDGHTVACQDLTCGPLSAAAVRAAGLVAFYLPMHTATRLALNVIGRVRGLNPEAHLCCYGLYAPLNEAMLRSLGVGTIFGGEFEPALAELAGRLERGQGLAGNVARTSLDRLQFITPDRTLLPPLDQYARLHAGGTQKLVAYTEASRGCKHLCRHCPVVPVYNGNFRVVQPEVVREDIRRQVAEGAGHITFGDPDFFNGPAHAVRIIEALHRDHPAVTYDVTIKIEHLLKHRDLLPLLKRTGCLFVTSAVESNQDEVLEKLDKGHTWSGFVEVVRAFRETGLTLAPTFVPFTPWTTWTGYRSLLRDLAELDLVDSVAPVQLSLRLLIPAGSRLLDLSEVREMIGLFDEEALVCKWRHPDPTLDALSGDIMRLAAAEEKKKGTRRQIFAGIWERAQDQPLPDNFDLMPRATIPYMDEPWYC
jgi:hypothetical protein